MPVGYLANGKAHSRAPLFPPAGPQPFSRPAPPACGMLLPKKGEFVSAEAAKRYLAQIICYKKKRNFPYREYAELVAVSQLFGFFS